MEAGETMDGEVRVAPDSTFARSAMDLFLGSSRELTLGVTTCEVEWVGMWGRGTRVGRGVGSVVTWVDERLGSCDGVGTRHFEGSDCLWDSRVHCNG